MAKPWLFIDSDIMIDLLAKREHHSHAAALFRLLDLQVVEGHTTAIVLANVEYIIRKYSSRRDAKKSIQTLLSMLHILTMNEAMAKSAAESKFPDFEDAMQYYAAVRGKMNFIITRNKKDYSAGTLRVLTAEEFIDMHSAASERAET